MALRQTCYPHRKVFSLVLILLFLWATVQVEVDVLDRFTESRRFFYSGYLFETPGCKFPNYEPFHWTIMFHHESNSDNDSLCRGQKSPVFFRNHNVPFLDERLLRSRHGLTPKGIRCFYADVRRNHSAPMPDKHSVYGQARKLVFGRKLRSKYIFLWCEEAGSGSKGRLFSQYFLLPQKWPKGRKRLRHPEHLSVLVLGLDATSRLNTIRQLPRTRRYLLQELNAFEFLGYNKVGENSYPNLIPLLTGLPSTAVAELIGDRYYDAMPSIMSLYRRKGYRTLFLEEEPKWGLFTYGKRFASGFKRAPAHLYPQAAMSLWNGSTCAILRYVTELLSMGDQPTFAFAWLTRMSHHDFNLVGYLDRPLESMLRKLSAAGAVKHTAILMLADHGLRHGISRGTEIGREEDKAPFAFLALPQRFLRRHPEAAVNLEVNQRRLVTAYDLYATLLSLGDLSRFEPAKTDRGRSLLSAIPPERTCEDAFVPPSFCACANADVVSIEPSVGRALAVSVLDHVNELTLRVFEGKCVTWRLARVEDAVATSLNSSMAGKVFFRLSLVTVPEASFEATGWIPRVDRWQERRVELVQRTDAYANHTRCLPQHELQKLCWCREQRTE